MNKPVLACRGLQKAFQLQRVAVPVLDNIDLELHAGESLAIVGASGSGKSTLLHLLGGLDTPSAGQIELLGQDLLALNETQRGEWRNRHLGFVYQFHHLLPEFSALENVAMPLRIRGLSAKAAAPVAEAILDKVGLNHRLHHLPAELSGGERQRAAVARALVTRPDCVLADEPTGNLDRYSALALFDLLAQLQSELRTSFIIVTHDLSLASRMQRTLQLVDGQLQELAR